MISGAFEDGGSPGGGPAPETARAVLAARLRRVLARERLFGTEFVFHEALQAFLENRREARPAPRAAGRDARRSPAGGDPSRVRVRPPPQHAVAPSKPPVERPAPAPQPRAARRPPDPVPPEVALQAGATAEEIARRRALLDPIRQEAAACTRCPLHKGRKQAVFGVGNPCARLLFVGEAPGADEDRRGEPFVGRAGRLLTDIIRAMRLRREDVYIANVIKCRPPGNRTPEAMEMASCLPYLRRQIEIIQPEVICALGSVAARGLLGAKGSLASMRGRFHEFEGRKVRVTYHPAYLLRNPADKRKTWEDVQAVMEVLGLKV